MHMLGSTLFPSFLKTNLKEISTYKKSRNDFKQKVTEGVHNLFDLNLLPLIISAKVIKQASVLRKQYDALPLVSSLN